MKKGKTRKSNQKVNTRLKTLLEEAKSVVQEIDETNNQALALLDDIDAKVDESTKVLEKIYSDLDQMEKNCGDEIDKLVLELVKGLSEETEE